MKSKVSVLIIFCVCSAFGLFAQSDMQETVAMIKKNLTESKANLVNYEWLETTTTFLKGEQKSVKQNQCYYSVDGKLTKVETGGGTQAKTKGGIRGRVIENKKEEMADYVKAAISKIHTYLPPDASKIQQIYSSGKTTIQVLEPGKKFKINFPDYNAPGDMLSFSVDKANQKIIALDINTYIDEPGEKVLFNVTYKDLPDGTQYANLTTLNADAKNLKIVIDNSGFKKASGK